MNKDLHSVYKQLKSITEESKSMLQTICVPNFKGATSYPPVAELNYLIDLLMHNNNLLNLTKNRVDALASEINAALSAKHQDILRRTPALSESSDIDQVLAACDNGADIDTCNQIKEFRNVISKINRYVDTIQRFKYDLDDLRMAIARQNIEISHINQTVLGKADQLPYISNA